MKILNIKMENFKNFRKKEIRFGDFNEIYGDNYRGKSSIAEAIAACLKGVNLEGSNRLTRLIRRGEVSSNVEIEFFHKNKLHRVLRNIRKNGTQLFYNGHEISQMKLDQKLKWVNTETFLYVFLPNLAIERLKNKHGRDFFISLVDDVNSEQVLARLDRGFLEYIERTDTNEPSYLINKLRDEIKECEEDLKYSEGMLDSFQVEILKPIPNYKSMDSFIEKLEKLNEEMELMQEKLQADLLEIEKKINRYEYELQIKNNDCDLSDTIEMENNLNRMRIEYNILKKSLRNLQLSIKAGDMCPTCSQLISKDIEEQLLINIREERIGIENKIDDLKIKGKSLANSLKKVEDENFARLDSYNKNEKIRVDKISQKIAGLYKQKKEIEDKIRLNNDRINDRKGLENKIESIKKDNYQREVLLQRKEDLLQKSLQLKEKVKGTQNVIYQKNEKIKALFHYIQTKSELISEQIAQHLKDVSIELFELNKSTGELKPVFKLLYKGTPVENCSLSEKIRAGLEIGDLIKKITGEHIPTFIDNGESITHYDFDIVENQLFTSTVIKGKDFHVKVNNLEGVSKEEEINVKIS